MKKQTTKQQFAFFEGGEKAKAEIIRSAALTPEAERLLANFEVLVEAPGGAKKLRETILGLALHGRLVVQDPREEPVSKLLQKIASARAPRKATAEDEGAAFRTSQSNDLPQLPESWRWAPTDSVADCILGKMLDGAKHTKGKPRPYLRNINVRWAGFDTTNLLAMFFEDNEFERYGVKVGDVLICEGGEPGRAAVWTDASATMFIQKAIHRVRLHGGIIPQWLVLNLRYDTWTNRLASYFTGATIKHFTGRALGSYPIRLAPVAEQARIVAKVDELMALCDEMEARQAKRRVVAGRLNKAALGELTTAEGPEEFAASLQRVLGNFEALAGSPERVSELRRTIVELAVRGRLVEQHLGDESAAPMRDRLSAKYASGEFDHEDRMISPPFQLAPGWCWARLPQLGVFGRGRSKHRPRNDAMLFKEGCYPLIQTGDVARSNGTIMTHTSMYNEAGLAQSRLWPKGTLCITIAANIADTGILGFDACFPDSVVGFISDPEIESARYFEIFLQTAKSHIEDFAPATAQKNINLEILSAVLIPLPPKNEMARIVAKVDHLMALCDSLEAKLRAADEGARRLAESLVAELIA